MINARITLRNPWSDRFETVKTWAAKIGTNWAWEIDCFRSSDVLDVFVRVTPNTDHAGVFLGLGIMTWNIEFSVYDRRHLAPL